MTLAPYRSRFDLSNLHKEMDDLFDSFFGNGRRALAEQRSLWPPTDVIENENEIVVKSEVPGCKAEDIEISVHGNTLTISGESKQEEERKETGYYHRERVYGSFSREITLPSDVISDKVAAVCKEGILTVRLPKSEKAKSIKVKVKDQ